MHHQLIALAAAKLAACLVFTCGPAPAMGQVKRPGKKHSLQLVTREFSLGHAHPGEIENTRMFSPNGRRLAFVAKVAGGETVFVDGKPGKVFTQIARDPFSESGDSFPILFSADDRRVGYIARRGEKYIVVIDGNETSDYDYVHTATLQFSSDSRRFLHSAKRGDKQFVVIDGVAVTQYEHATRPRFSDDGRRISFEARREGRNLFVVDGIEFAENDPKGRLLFDGKEEKVNRIAEKIEEDDKSFIVVNGVRSGPYDRLDSVRISQDQKRVMYSARRGDKWFVVVDGTEGKMYNSIDTYSASFSPDGKHFAYKASQDRTQFVVLDGNEGQPYIYVGDLTFSTDGQHLLYLAFRDGKTILVNDGVEGASFDGRPGHFLFSPDRKRMVYQVEKLGAGKHILVADGGPFAYDEIRNVMFSPDSRFLIFKAQRGEGWVMVVNGVESREYEADGDVSGMKVDFSRDDEIAFTRSSNGPVSSGNGPVSSTAGSRVAYVARRAGKDFVVVDGVEGKSYDDVRNLAFTAEGQHVVYTAQRGTKHIIVVDGVESREYDEFVSRNRHEHAELKFASERSLYILAKRGQEYLRVEIDILEK